MPRTLRASLGGLAYHCINRGNQRREVFLDPTDYDRFVGLISSACDRLAMRILAYCLMPNHFHFVLWPRNDRDLSRWMHWLLTTHVRRHHRRYRTDGRVWQGRFKAFPIQQDGHLLTVLRYVERNPVRANLVTLAEDWGWSSLDLWRGTDRPSWFDEGPVPRYLDWVRYVNEPQTASELVILRENVNKERPYGDQSWVRISAERLHLASSLRSRGRPCATL